MCSGPVPALIWSSQYGPVTRLPTSRPCRSGNATTTVSTAPAVMSFASSSGCSIPRAAITAAYLLGRHVRGGDAAVHHERRAGHERGVVGGEEERGLRQLLRLSEAPHRDVHHATGTPGGVRHERGEERRLDRAGTQRVRADALTRVLDRDLACHRQDAAL